MYKSLFMKKIFLVLLALSLAFSSFSQKIEFLNDQDFKAKVWDYSKNTNFTYEGDKPLIIDFYADWCGPCRQIAPHLEALQQQYGNKLQVYKIDVDKYGNISNLFNIRSIPTLLFVKPKGDFSKVIGYKSKEQLDELIKSTFGL